MSHDSQQVQTFGDIAMGDGNVFTINQIIQVTASEIQIRPLNTNSPYRGLKRFEVGDKDLFFGRDQLIAKLIDNLKHHNHLLILGASGSGKSSVMRAGVLPQLISQLSDTLQTFTFTPDRNPFRSLWGCLVSSGFKQSDADCVLDKPDHAMLTLIKQYRPASAQWLFFIDQFEEIFTLCQDVTQRQLFIRNLLQASSVGRGAVKIVLAMRADFLDRFGSYPELGQIAQQNIYLITDMHPDELRLAIEQPAAKHGVVFEAGLVDEIIRDLKDQAGALPLLQYTLHLLWQRSDLDHRTLRCKTYRELGGVRGALQQRVEDLYGALDECDRTTTKQIFLRLVDITGAAEEMDVVGKAVSRRAALSEFDHEAAQKVLPQLIDANLLVSNRQDISTVELAHETLINAWPKLKQWIDDSKEVIVMQNRLSDDAHNWQQMQTEDPNRARDELWRGAKLQRALELREEGLFELWLGGLSQEESDFLKASVESRDRAAREVEHRRKQQLKLYQRFAIAASFLCACIAGLSLWLRISWVEAEQQRISETAKSSAYAFGAFESNRYTLDALLEGLSAGRAIQDGYWAKKNEGLNRNVLSALSSAMYWVSERNRLEGHLDSIFDLAFSPDGQWIATASADQTVRLWDQDGILVHSFPAHDNTVRSITFSPDSQSLLTSSLDRTAVLWSLSEQKLQTFEGYPGQIYSTTFSHDAQVVAIAGEGGTVELWKLDGEQAFSSFPADDEEVWDIIFGPQNQSVITGGQDGVAKMWSLDGKLLHEFRGHSQRVTEVALSPDHHTLATASPDGTVRLWDVKLRKPLIEISAHPEGAYTVSFSPDGKIIASGGSDNTAKVWSTGGQLLGIFATQPLEIFEGHKWFVTSVRFSPDGKILASASLDKTAKLWQLNNGQLYKLRGHTGSVEDVAFSKEASLIATADFDNKIRLWSLDGELKNQIEEHTGSVYRVQFSADGQTLYSASADGTVGQWDIQSQKWTNFRAHPDNIRGLAINRSNTLIATSDDDNVIRLWSTSGELQQELPTSLVGAIQDVVFGTNDHILVAAHQKGLITLWNTRSGEYIKTLEAHKGPVHALAVNLDQSMFASAGDDGIVKIWNFEGEVIRSLTDHKDAVWDVAFSPDNNFVATAGSDQTIKLWQRNGKLMATLRGHQEGVNAIKFSADGQWLISGGNDAVALLWNLKDFNLDGIVRKSCHWLKSHLESQQLAPCQTSP